MIEAKPSDEALWRKWFFWQETGGGERPLGPLVERIKRSPLAPLGSTLPPDAMSEYYNECKKNGRWDKATAMLKTAWDRDFARMLEEEAQPTENLNDIGDFSRRRRSLIGDRVGVPLIEAYLRDNKPVEAGEVFSAWLDAGKKFQDIAKLVELAKELGHERLAREWEAKAGK